MKLILIFAITLSASVWADPRPLTGPERAVLEYVVIDAGAWWSHAQSTNSTKAEKHLKQKVETWKRRYENARFGVIPDSLRVLDADSIFQIPDSLRVPISSYKVRAVRDSIEQAKTQP